MLIRGAGDSAVSPELQRRLVYAFGVVALALLALIARLWQLQIVRGEEYFEAARSNVVAEQLLPSVRGKIVDRNGVPLADNRPAFHIYVTPRMVGEEAAAELADILELTPDERARFTERLAAARKRNAKRPALMLEDQSRDRAGLVAQARLRLGPGIEVRDEPYRDYPFGEIAGHLVGYMNQPNSREMVELEALGYDPSEFIGRYGIEREWENFLHGKKGIERFITNAKGDRVEDSDAEKLIEGPHLVPPAAGHDVVLTIDMELQKLAEQAVRAQAAAAVAVVEVDSGRILALVSTPSFDPNIMTGHLSRAEDERLQNDPRRPYVDKTLQQHYPPGSVYKFVVGGAALEDALVSPHERILCSGAEKVGRRVFHCNGNHGLVDMFEATQHSCNIYFWELSERTGMDRMAEVARDFGFGAPTGLALNGDMAGRVPTKAFYEDRGFQIGHTLNAATGQGDVEVTVLQVAMAYAALANGGRLYAPQVVDRVVAASGEVVAKYEPVLRRRVSLSAATLDVWRQGMWKVVNEPGGTAYSHGRSEVVDIAGKTGTAQVRARRKHEEKGTRGWDPKRAHAWFAGYAPAFQPKIAIAVLIEHGGSGGHVAAPVAKDILEAYFTKVDPSALPNHAGRPPSASAAAIEESALASPPAPGPTEDAP